MICTLLSFLSFIAKIMAGNQERTFIMIKPDGVQRGLVGDIIKRFEAKGFKLVAMKFMWVSKIRIFLIFYFCLGFELFSRCHMAVRISIAEFFVQRFYRMKCKRFFFWQFRTERFVFSNETFFLKHLSFKCSCWFVLEVIPNQTLFFFPLHCSRLFSHRKNYWRSTMPICLLAHSSPD